MARPRGARHLVLRGWPARGARLLRSSAREQAEWRRCSPPGCARGSRAAGKAPARRGAGAGAALRAARAAPSPHLVDAGRQELDDGEVAPRALQNVPRGPVVEGALNLDVVAAVAPCGDDARGVGRRRGAEAGARPRQRDWRAGCARGTLGCASPGGLARSRRRRPSGLPASTGGAPAAPSLATHTRSPRAQAWAALARPAGPRTRATWLGRSR
jgi:hypothetical protein